MGFFKGRAAAALALASHQDGTKRRKEWERPDWEEKAKPLVVGPATLAEFKQQVS